VPLLGVVAGTFGLPRWIVSRLTKRRQNKFIDEFANAIDVIVRGVKSGLPLPECLAIIIAIQQQSGGNLSEVLGNLSGVLRARRARCVRSPRRQEPRPPCSARCRSSS
jgi:tight adherence protein B